MQRCRDSADPHPSVCSTREVGNVLEAGGLSGDSYCSNVTGAVSEISRSQPSDDADPAEPTGKPLTPQKQHEGHRSLKNSRRSSLILPKKKQERLWNRTRGGKTGYGGEPGEGNRT